jgi:hypothetical protein
MDDKPICCDLYSGLGGWAEGFISEGYHCRGFDIEAHDYGSGGYPGELIIRDVRSIHGSECKDAAVIVASPPCQEPSYRAMPWKRARALSPEEVGIPAPEWWDKPESKMSHVELLSWRVWQREYSRPDPKLFIELFNSCFRIQREAIEAAGHYIPLVIENVRGAQRWVGRARANYGSYYLWGDVGMVGRRIVAGIPKFGITVAPVKAVKVPGFRFDGDGGSFQTAAVKTVGHVNIRDGHTHARHLTNQRESDAVKVPGITFSGYGEDEYKSVGFNVTAAQRYRDGVKQTGISGVRENGKGDKWFQDGAADHGSRSNSRKAASAMIAKIPFPLAQHIARVFKPIPVDSSSV